MAAHRYWRWLFSAVGNGSDYAAVGEAELRAEAGGTDQTGSGTASADSENAGVYVAARAFANDGSDHATATWISSPTAWPHWLQYDFGAGQAKEIVEYTLTTTQYPAYMPIAWHFQYSDDQSAWTTPTIVSGLSWSEYETKLFSAQPLFGRVFSAQFRGDLGYGGNLQITESVTRLNAPAWRRVRLCDQASGTLVREGWSDAVTGDITFPFLSPGPWALYALDHTGEFEAVAISDRLATVDGSRP